LEPPPVDRFWAIFFYRFRSAIDLVIVRNLAGGKRRRYQYQLYFALLVHFAYDAIILHFPEEFRPIRVSLEILH